MLNTDGIVVAVFLVTNQVNQVGFFKEIFLLANSSPKIVFGIFFLILISVNIDFLDRELQ